MWSAKITSAASWTLLWQRLADSCDPVTDAKILQPIDAFWDPSRPPARFIDADPTHPPLPTSSGSGESFSSKTIDVLCGTKDQTSSSNDRHSVNPSVAVQLVLMARGASHRQARNPARMAPSRFSFVLEMEVEAPRSAADLKGRSGADSADGRIRCRALPRQS